MGLQEYCNPTFHLAQMGKEALWVTRRLKKGMMKAGGGGWGDKKGTEKRVVFFNYFLNTQRVEPLGRNFHAYHFIVDSYWAIQLFFLWPLAVSCYVAS